MTDFVFAKYYNTSFGRQSFVRGLRYTRIELGSRTQGAARLLFKLFKLKSPLLRARGKLELFELCSCVPLVVPLHVLHQMVRPQEGKGQEKGFSSVWILWCALRCDILK